MVAVLVARLYDVEREIKVVGNAKSMVEENVVRWKDVTNRVEMLVENV